MASEHGPRRTAMRTSKRTAIPRIKGRGSGMKKRVSLILIACLSSDLAALAGEDVVIGEGLLIRVPRQL
jgi:hypothetical protein